MTTRLREDAFARIDEDDGQVCCGCTGDHIARVLFVPGRVGDDELALRRCEEAVGDVDGDSLLALGAQAVGQQRQVQGAVAAAAVPLCWRRTFESMERGVRLSARRWLWRVVLETGLFLGFGLVFAAGSALLLYFGFRFLAGWRFGLLSFIVGSIVVLLIEVCSAVSESARDAAESYMTRRTAPNPESSPRLEPSTGNAKESAPP